MNVFKINTNQQGDRPPETAEPDLEKTEMSTKEPSFNLSLSKDGIESSFVFEDAGSVPGILNEVGDTGSNEAILFNEAGESVGTSVDEFEFVEQLTDGASIAEIEDILDFGEGNTITLAGSFNVEQFEALQPAEVEIVSGEGIFDGVEGSATLTQAEPDVLDVIEIDLSIESNSSIESNPFTDYFDPFSGVHLPAQGEPVLSDGEDGYTVDDLFVFGDRLTENGGEFGKNAVAESTGANPPYDFAPYSPLGNFTNGLNWTTSLASTLGVEDYTEQDSNFSYLDATARELVNPVDPFGEATELNTFAGQIDTFESTYGTFTEDDLVVINFGGNDLTLPPEEGVAPEEAAQQSIEATIDGIARLQELGAKNFLVGLVPPVELAPIFSDPEFQALLGVEPGFFGPVVEGYNQGLTAALGNYETESGANIEIFDTGALFNAIAENPEAFGFLNIEEPVLISQTPLTGEPPAYNPAIIEGGLEVQQATLFIDPFFHPTALGHSLVAETALDELLNAEPVSGTGVTVGLYDTDTDTLIAPIENGTQIQKSEVADKNLTVAVSISEDSVLSEVESVFLDLNDGQVTRTENVEPYALSGDRNGDYFPGEVDFQGDNTIAFELYSEDELGGEMLDSMSINFSIV